MFPKNEMYAVHASPWISRNLDANPVPLNQFLEDKTRILGILNSAADRIKSEHNE